MSLRSKIETFFWFFVRPSHYKQLFALIKMRVFKNKKEDTRKEAESWCDQIMVTTEEALLKITNKNTNSIETLFEDIFVWAKQVVENSPVKMGGAGDTSLLYHLCEYIEAKNVVETGVAYGWSSLSILLSLQNRENSKLVSTDMPYAKMNNEDYVGCVVPENLRLKWNLLRVPDRKGLPIAFKLFEQIDLCHYDSDKSYGGRVWAYPKLWGKLRNGGVFVSDDISDNIAFKEFSEKLEIEPTVIKIRDQFVGVLIKP
jgi:predicted O-methyltransferase YrrM